MDITTLEKARFYEDIYGPQIPPEQRPLFHLTPKVGWMNDPNGFSMYHGEFHLFYQYHPYNTKWGPMHWGHAKTKDLLHWEWLPSALAPDMDYDNAGCFSGSAIELQDGRQLLLYTGVQEHQHEDGSIETNQVQCLAYGDGINYQKYAGNPVLTVADLPEGGSSIDFRDPKVWQEEDGWYAVIGNRCADGSGTILLFHSEDTMHWKFVTVLEKCHNEYGKMWECPDFFPLGDYQILITSPQEMMARGLEFHNGNSTIYITGTYGRKTHTFKRIQVKNLDYGLDFYAPQTTLAPDGRRILIAWMQSWESTHSQPEGTRWFGMMTLPRELSIRNGQLIQTPIRELDEYRTNHVSYRNVDVGDRIQLPRVSGRTVDLIVSVHPTGCDCYKRFTLKVAKDSEVYTAIIYEPGRSVLRFDRSHSGFCHDILHMREAVVHNQSGELKLRVILDRFSVEVFINDGEQVMSSTIYTPLSASAISFEAFGGAMIDVDKYDIEL